MAIRKILVLGNPLLRSRSAAVKNFSDPFLARTIDDLRETLAEFRNSHGFGRGIAAPQIGVSLRLIVIQIEKQIVIVNPRIIKHSQRRMTLWDDCFSFPEILVKVRRNVSITVRYNDERGESQQIQATGDLSELLQHEIDHVDGILAIDRAIDTKHIVLRSEWRTLVNQTSTSLKM